MGNKQSQATRAFSTTTPPNATTVAHHRLNRRRSDFQHSGKRSAEQLVASTMGPPATAHFQQQQQQFSATTTTITSTNGTSSSMEAAPTPMMTLAVERAKQRRRCSSAALVNARNNAIQKPKRITPRQCHLVIKSWSKRSPKNRIAKDIFAAIFTEAEELKATFGIDTGSTGKRLRTDANFVAHTNMFADTLDFVVRNLDDISLVIENAEQLGRRHASFPVENGFRPEYWNIFTECISEGVCSGEDDKETCLGWRLLIQTIVYYMKVGYDREVLRIQRHGSFRRSASPLASPRELPEAPTTAEWPHRQNYQFGVSEEYR